MDETASWDCACLGVDLGRSAAVCRDRGGRGPHRQLTARGLEQADELRLTTRIARRKRGLPSSSGTRAAIPNKPRSGDILNVDSISTPHV